MAGCPSLHNGRGKVISEEEMEFEVREKEIKKAFLQKHGPGWFHCIFVDTLTVQLWSLAKLPVSSGHGNVTTLSSEVVETWMIPACKGKGSSRKKKYQQQTINTVQITSDDNFVCVEPRHNFGYAWGSFNMLLSFKPFNTEYAPGAFSSERIAVKFPESQSWSARPRWRAVPHDERIIALHRLTWYLSSGSAWLPTEV